jgi:hypothetical protein
MECKHCNSIDSINYWGNVTNVMPTTVWNKTTKSREVETPIQPNSDSMTRGWEDG